MGVRNGGPLLLKQIHAWHCAEHFTCIILLNLYKQKEEGVRVRCLRLNADSVSSVLARLLNSLPLLSRAEGEDSHGSHSGGRCEDWVQQWVENSQQEARIHKTSDYMRILLLLLLLFKWRNWDLQRMCLLPCHPANCVELGPRPWSGWLQRQSF